MQRVNHLQFQQRFNSKYMGIEIIDIEAQNKVVNCGENHAIFKKANPPVTLRFEDVVYHIKNGKRGFLGKDNAVREEKLILKGISGVVRPGQMLGMMGPSGSGKTTLLTALGGRLGGHLSGTITYNGKPFSNKRKRSTGFVTQDDVLYPHLTVIETLVYTALLRLPKSLTTQEKVQHAEAVITQLGLSKCRDNIIGGPFLRGVSGGERKRVSIGQEMLINPSLLFLDEPTSGLDSTTAHRIVSVIRDFANGGRTVLMTIHQPSSRLFYMFHKVLLLSDGNPLYFGESSGALDYFSSIGFTPSIPMNPADFLLDIANGFVLSSDESEEDQMVVKKNLVTAYQTNLSHTVKSEVSIDNRVFDSEEDKQFGQWSNTWWRQFSVLFIRGLKERKHETFDGLKIAQVLVVSILSGLLWWQSKISNLQDQVGFFFFTTTFWGLIPIFQAIYTFPQERMMLAKERSSGMYRLSSFFMALTLGSLPMVIILPTIYFTISYWMAGLKATTSAFLSGLFIILYHVLCSQGLGFAIGAIVMNPRSASVLGSVIGLVFQLASGFYVPNVPIFIRWIKYLSINQYIFKLLLSTQYKPDETYPCGVNKTCLVRDFPAIKSAGLDGQLVSVIVLAAMLVGYRFIAYLSLMRIGVTKK